MGHNDLNVWTRRGLLVGLLVPGLARARDTVDIQDACHGGDFPPPPFTALYGSFAFVASAHTNQLGSPTFAAIEALFQWRPSLIILEGVHTQSGVNPVNLIQQARSARTTGAFANEAIFAAAQADERGVALVGAQPPESAIVEAQLKLGFAPETIFGARVLSELQGLRLTHRSDTRADDARQCVAKLLPSLGPPLGLSSFDVLDWYVSAFHQRLEDDPRLSQRGTPCGDDLVARTIAAATAERNRHLLRLIDFLRSRQPRLAAIQGAGHFYAISAALSARFGQPNFKNPVL